METVVVIGDGPSPDGMMWGSVIDRHVVVRIWNHEWQSIGDYGTRYDHGLITSHRCPAFRIPAVSWFFYNDVNEADVSEIKGTAVVHLHHKMWLDRAVSEGARPEKKVLKLTRGFVAAAGAIENLRPSRLVLVGMDMLQARATTSPRYGAAAAAYRQRAFPGAALEEGPAGSPREGPHDYPAEAALLASLADAAGTEIAWGF